MYHLCYNSYGILIEGVEHLIYTLARTSDNQFLVDLPLDELIRPDIEWYWVDFDTPTETEAQQLTNFFQFHPLAVEDCFHFLQRPKLDYYDGYSFFVLHELDPKTLESNEIDVFLSQKFMITFHLKPSTTSEVTRHRCLDSQFNIKITSTVDLFHQYLDKIVDQYFPTVYQIEDRLDEIVSHPREHTGNKLMNEVFEIRNDLLWLRRSIFPMRDLLYRILGSERIEIPKEQRAYFTDIYDHLLKLAEMVESNREITSDIRDNYISMNANRMNHIMMTLTVISAIFIPLTFVAGVYGMNFEYMPELEWKYGYFMILGFMGFIGVSMFLWFKMKGWFGDN